MDLNVNLELEQLVKSPSNASFIELVDKVAGEHMCLETKRFVPDFAGSAFGYFTRLSENVRVFECQID
jgi:hypothetical protein